MVMTSNKMVSIWLCIDPQKLGQKCKRIAVKAIPALFFLNICYAYIQSTNETDFCVTERDYKYEAVNQTCDTIRDNFKNHIKESLVCLSINVAVAVAYIIINSKFKCFNDDLNLWQSIYFFIFALWQSFTIVYTHWWIFDLQVVTEECSTCCVIVALPCTKNYTGACVPKIANNINSVFCVAAALLVCLNIICVCSSFTYLCSFCATTTNETTEEKERVALNSPINDKSRDH